MNSSSPSPSGHLGLGPALGYLALVPFVACAVGAHVGGAELSALALKALVAYAAVVVSFIGALHWGLAFSQSQPAPSLLLWGVCPAIAAWLAQWMPASTGLWILAALLLLCYGVDLWVYPRAGVARWLPLRLRLTAVAGVCCLVGAMAATGARLA